jgi:hypothetical protein
MRGWCVTALRHFSSIRSGLVGSRAGAVVVGSGSRCLPAAFAVCRCLSPFRHSVSSSRHVARSMRISRTTRSCALRAKGYGAFYVAAVVKPFLPLFCLCWSLRTLHGYDTTSCPDTRRTESVQRSSCRGGRPCAWLVVRVLCPAPSRRPVTLPTASLPARHVCWWLRQAWGSLVPNDLLYVSAAPAPSTLSCMRPEAPGEARVWATPSIKRFARRTRPINESPTPTHRRRGVTRGHRPSCLLPGSGAQPQRLMGSRGALPF